VRDFYGAITAAGASWGCIVTSGMFTTQAQQFAKGNGLYLIEMDVLMEAFKSPNVLVQMFR
jgi:restriction system protein